MTMNRRKAALDALDIIISQAYVESEEEPDDDSMSDADYEQDFNCLQSTSDLTSLTPGQLNA